MGTPDIQAVVSSEAGFCGDIPRHNFMLSIFLSLLLCTTADKPEAVGPRFNIGINYGRLGDNLPPPDQVVTLIKNLNIGKVKIFDADPHVLSALANTGLEVVIGLNNEELPSIASSSAAADQWVQQNVLLHYPATHIKMIVVGNEILSNYENQAIWLQLVPAMQNVYAALQKNNVGRFIKVTTSVALNALNSSYPPSAGCFRDDIATSVIRPMLQFLSNTRSYFFINVYPYFAWSANADEIPLQYALFGSSVVGVGDGDFHYTDLLDAQLDAAIAAMARLGYPNVKIAISETGWPTRGDSNQPGANVANAAYYNRRLVRKMLAYPPFGTPRRPATFIPTFLFSLFNEDRKPGPTTERNWGILYPDGTQVYPIDLTGKLVESRYAPLNLSLPLPAIVTAPPPPHTSSPDTETPLSGSSHHHHASPNSSEARKQWCVANAQAMLMALQTALDYACGQEAALCNEIQFNGPCYQPNTLLSHASYAFNKYWQMMKHRGGTCDFRGAAIVTNKNPSYTGCEYLSSP